MAYKHQQYPSEPMIRFVKAYKAAVEDVGKKTFCDIGCGAGRHLWLAGVEGFSPILGTDIEAFAELLWDNAEFKQNDITKESPGKFDVVVCDGVLDHIPYKDFGAALENVCASVAPGGWLYISLIHGCPDGYTGPRSFFLGVSVAKYCKGVEAGEVQSFFERRGINEVIIRAGKNGLMWTFFELGTRKFNKPGYDPETWARWHLWFTRPR